MESKRRLSDDEESELKSLWRKLVKLFHPDRQPPSQDGGQDYPGSLGP